MKKMCIARIKIIWTTITTTNGTLIKLYFTACRIPWASLVFTRDFSASLPPTPHPSQLLSSPTCKFFSFLVSQRGPLETQVQPSLPVVLWLEKGAAQSFKLDPTSWLLTKLNSSKKEDKKTMLVEQTVCIGLHASLQFTCLWLPFSGFFWRQWIFLLHFIFFSFYVSNFSISAIWGLSDIVVEEAEWDMWAGKVRSVQWPLSLNLYGFKPSGWNSLMDERHRVGLLLE